jgi:hypothetical protein
MLSNYKNDCSTYYALKLFKSQARYIQPTLKGKEWLEENIHIINGISRNIRIDMNDQWLVTQNSARSSDVSRSEIHHPTEAASKWAVNRLFKKKEYPLSSLSLSMMNDANEECANDQRFELGIDSMLCLDGIDGEKLVSEWVAPDLSATHLPETNNEHFSVDGVGIYSLYNNPLTNIPNDFFDGDTWKQWLENQQFLISHE